MKLLPNKIKYLIIHHSATTGAETSFEAVRNYHLSKGWGDIGYHYFIDREGKVYPGRAENIVGAHCEANNMNVRSLGICLAGNFMDEKPTDRQLVSLNSLLQSLLAKYHIPKILVLGHREVYYAKTSCPGNNLINWIKNFRKQK